VGFTLEGAALIARGLAPEEPGRDEVALGSLLAGYALGATGLALHHVVCQTLVLIAGTSHAQTNAVMLPHSVRLMAPRVPHEIGRFAEALGSGSPDPAAAGDLVTPLAARSGVSSLSAARGGRRSAAGGGSSGGRARGARSYAERTGRIGPARGVAGGALRRWQATRAHPPLRLR